MSGTRFRITMIAVLVLVTACRESSQTAEQSSPAVTVSQPATNPTTPVSPQGSDADKWLGKWTGPEGTSLVLSRSGDRFVVTIQSLDGPATYEGVAAADRIEFTRDGRSESIRAGSGKETGMKWLLDKKNCLVIKEGEGFCRE